MTIRTLRTVKEAVDLMNANEIGCLVVVDDEEKPVGIVTERDLIKRVLAKRIDPEKVKVKEIISKPIMIGTSHMDLEATARLMFKKRLKNSLLLKMGG